MKVTQHVIYMRRTKVLSLFLICNHGFLLAAGHLDIARSPDETLTRIYQEARRHLRYPLSPELNLGNLLSGSVYEEREINLSIDARALTPATLEGIIQRTLPDAFYAVYPNHDSTQYRVDIYPKISMGDMRLYATPWKNAIFLLQGEWAITSAQDANPILATYALGQTCRALILYDPQLKVAAFAHIDALGEDDRTYFAMMARMKKEGSSKFQVAYSPNVDNYVLQAMRKDLGDRLVGEFKIPMTSVSFDSRTGRSSPVDLGTLLMFATNNGNLMKRERRVAIRLENTIPLQFPTYPPGLSLER